MGMTPNQIVSWNLRRARDARHMTQEDVAEALGISPANYSLIETSWKRNTRIRQHTTDDLLAYARLFDVPIVFFLLPPVENGELVESVEARDGRLDGAGYLSNVLPVLDGDWLAGPQALMTARMKELTEIVETDQMRNLQGLVERQAEHSIEEAMPEILEFYRALSDLSDDVRAKTNELQRLIEAKVIDPAWRQVVDEMARIKYDEGEQE